MKTKYTDEQHEQIVAIGKETDRVKRWKLIHDLVRSMNKKARKEQDAQEKAMAKVRNEGLYRKKKTKTLGLKFSVSIPNITYQALVDTDVMLFGKSDLKTPDKQNFKTKDATNEIARDLARAFPQYRAS